jgi:precorrin-6x reductase
MCHQCDTRTVDAINRAGIPVADWERTAEDEERSSYLVVQTPLRAEVGARETYRRVLSALGDGDGMTPLWEIQAVS